MHRFALIGAGRIGRIHAANLATLAGAELACIADTDASAAETLARLHGARVVSAPEAIVADSPASRSSARSRSTLTSSAPPAA
jgi:myo-inositol 2-dehydrogenase/D-chiro-inositol 1-dehydrogenase